MGMLGHVRLFDVKVRYEYFGEGGKLYFVRTCVRWGAC